MNRLTFLTSFISLIAIVGRIGGGHNSFATEGSLLSIIWVMYLVGAAIISVSLLLVLIRGRHVDVLATERVASPRLVPWFPRSLPHSRRRHRFRLDQLGAHFSLAVGFCLGHVLERSQTMNPSVTATA
jgi:hypothetical protein